MLTKPGREVGLIKLPACERKDKGDDFFFWCINPEAVQPKKEVHGLEGDTLVPVNEGMVLGEPKPIRCGKGGKVRVSAVVESVPRTFNGGLQETPVPKSEGAAVSFDLIRMDSHNVNESKPTEFGHLASSRMALR